MKQAALVAHSGKVGWVIIPRVPRLFHSQRGDKAGSSGSAQRQGGLRDNPKNALISHSRAD
jgi:hypothetical protein